MKNLDFLNKLKKENKIELVECSDQISVSYEKKGVECREVANLVFSKGYFETTVTQSYYSIYNNILSLFFKCGIKCESHLGAAMLLKEIFNQNEMHLIFSKAKEERIDKQYYVVPIKDDIETKASALNMIKIAEKLNLQIIAFKNNLNLNEIAVFRETIRKM